MPYTAAAIVAVTLLASIALVTECVHYHRSVGTSIAVPLSIMMAGSLLAADCLLIRHLKRFVERDRPVARIRRFQFSLSAMMKFVVIGGAWVSGLVLFFRP